MGIAASLFERRSTLAQPDAWLRKWFGALPDTYTGKEVNHNTALTYSGWAAGVLLISEVFGSLPRHLRRGVMMQGREASEVVREHPLNKILSERANPEMDAMEFWAIYESHGLSDGNFYAQKIVDGGGRIRELWPLEPSRMQVFRDGEQLKYLYTTAKGEQRAFLRDNIFHVRGLSRDGVKGIAPLELARQAVGIGLAVEEYAGRFFSNSASLRGVLSTEGKLGETGFQRLKKDWAEIYQGQANAHKVAILEEGLKFQAISVSPKDSQLLELRKFQVTEIARIIRVPPHLLQDLDRATFNNIEELGIGFVKYSLIHRCVRLEQAIASQLLTENERKALFAKHNLKGLLRGDTQKQGEFYKIGLEGGWLSPNDIRELEDLSPIPDGDLYTQQLQRAPLSVIAQAKPAGETPAEPEPDAEEDEGLGESDEGRAEQRALGRKERLQLRKTFEPLIRDAAERLVKFDAGLILQDGIREWKRGSAEFLLWLDLHHDRLVEEGAKRMHAALSTYGALVATASAKEVGGIPNDESVRQLIDGLIASFAARYAIASVAQLRAVVRKSADDGVDPEAQIIASAEDWKEKGPDRIAMRESVGFGNIVAKSTMALVGVTAFRWLSSGKSCPLCQQMNGRVIRGRQPFLGADETLEAEGTAPLKPSAPVIAPPLHGGCDCEIVPD